MTTPFSVVFVCTGNRFRSPLAYGFVQRLTVGIPVELQTAGMLELEGAPPLPEAQELAASCGVDISQHRSRPLAAVPVADVDLLLGFEADHIRRAIVDAGASPGRCFTFREFDQLLRNLELQAAADPVVRARAAVAQADELRRRESAPAGDAGDTPDPFGSSWSVYWDTAVEIRELSLALAEALFGIDDTGELPPIPEKRRFPGRFRRLIHGTRRAHTRD